jgi:hypothetical protein
MRSLLANPRGGAGEPAGTERFFIDDLNGCVMGRVFSQIDEVVLFHKHQKTVHARRIGVMATPKGVFDISVVAGFLERTSNVNPVA